MRQWISFLTQSPLFRQIDPEDLSGLLQCLQARTAAYPKEGVIFLAGNPAERVGLVLEGNVSVVRDDLLGNRTILAKLGPGDLFGETFACAGVDTLPVSVLAVTGCTVLLLNYRQIITQCSHSCVFHSRLIENMLRVLAEKNLLLNRKIETLAARTTREKLMAYLLAQAGTAASRSFTIPFNRQELADFLSVDRSGLSRELSAMQADGLLRFHKNHFELLDP